MLRKLCRHSASASSSEFCVNSSTSGITGPNTPSSYQIKSTEDRGLGHKYKQTEIN